MRSTSCRISAKTPERLLRLLVSVHLRHQLPVPSQQRVRRDDRRDLTQGLPTQPVGPYGESPAVVIGEPQAPAADLLPEDAILFDQIGERLPLPAIEPTGDGEEQQPKDRHVDHERELISQTRQESPQCCRS
jgi:hypothetical protein